MSFAVTADGGEFEWKGGGDNWIQTAMRLLAQPKNLLSTSYLWMLRDILTFNQQSVADYKAGKLAGLTLGDYFRQNHFAPRLLTDYLAPMGAAIWSAPAPEMLDFPAENFVAFFSNHRLLQYDRPVWRTVKGGSRRYVEKLTAAFRDRVRLGCAVTSVERTSHGVMVHDSHGRSDTYDHVVIAAHSDQALAMLSDADARERDVLGAIGYAPNTVYLHRDERLMPRRRRAWASWNFLRWQREDTMANDVAVTYWMNNLQGIDNDKPLFVSLNPPFAPPARSRSANTSASIRNITARPLPRRNASPKSREGAAPGSAVPGPDMVFTRMACVRGSKWPKRSAPMRPGARRRRNLRKPRSSDDASTRRLQTRGPCRALFRRGDACAAEADCASLQLPRHESSDRPQPAR